MAKRKITVSPKRRAKERFPGDPFPPGGAKLDLCRIRPWRFRELTHDQLNKASHSIGRLYRMPKNDKIRETLGLFVAALRAGFASEGPRGKRAANTDAEFYEKKILKMQRDAGCSVPAREMVARDMEETRRYSADEIDFVRRGKRRPRIR